MKICELRIEHFRGISEATLFFPDHVVLVGDNNVGKSTILEAIDLVLGPDRLRRTPPIDEHDFYLGDYAPSEEDEEPKRIKVEATVAGLNEEQERRFRDYLEWWDDETRRLLSKSQIEEVDGKPVESALRVTFIGQYDSEEDDFSGNTYFSRSLEESEDEPRRFGRRDKQYCGFLYLRSVRTGSRAMSLERGSLLDIVLRLKEIRPQMWEKTIKEVASLEVAADPELGISGVLESIEEAVRKYVPLEWASSPHLKVSNLTREHLRKAITAFVATGIGKHAAPFYLQGRGTLNMLVLAMLSQVAEEKRNVIFAMEEPETAIPPYAQKRIVREVQKLAVQSMFTSHSPYVLEEFEPDRMVVLSRDGEGRMNQAAVELPESVKLKRYRREFRTRFCEGLLSRRLVIVEGTTEASAMPAAARRLAELDPESYSSFEALGLCVVDAGSETQIVDLARLYGKLGKKVFAICDKQSSENERAIKKKVSKLFMHPEKGFEDLVVNNTSEEAVERFIKVVDLPAHLREKYIFSEEEPAETLCAYFKQGKGNFVIADFLSQCRESEIPDWIRDTCKELRELCQPDHGGG